MDTPEKVKINKLSKQDCIVGDASSCGRLVLPEDVGKIAEDKSCEIIGTKVNMYKGVNYLSLSPESQIELIDNLLQKLIEMICKSVELLVVLGQIDGVLSVNQCEACLYAHTYACVPV